MDGGLMAELWGYVNKFGRTPDMDAADSNEDIWDGTGAYTFPSSAAAMKISSSSTDDDGAPVGTGALTVRVIGLDANWLEVSQDVTLNGQTGVAIPTSLIRVYRAYVLTAGTGGQNAGDIWIGTGTITDGVPAVKYAGILATLGQTLMAIYTVPNHLSSAKITRWYGASGAVSASFGEMALQVRESGGAWRTRRMMGVAEGGGFDETLLNGITVGPKADIRIRAVSNGVNNTALQAGFDMELYT